MNDELHVSSSNIFDSVFYLVLKLSPFQVLISLWKCVLFRNNLWAENYGHEIMS